MIILLPLLSSLFFSILKNDEEKRISLYSLYLVAFIMLNISYGKDILIAVFLILMIIYWLNSTNTQWGSPSWATHKNLNLFSLYIIISSILVFNTNSIYSYFLSIELITFIIMVYINMYIQEKNIGIIYYLFSSLFSALFIFSFGYLSMGYYISYSFIILIFIWKLNLVPFHFLMPSIYNNLSPKLIFYIDIPSKLLIFHLLYKIVLSININFIYIILITLIVSTIIIMMEKNLINILIYSSLINYSLILIFIQYSNYSYFLIYIIFYSFMILIYLYLIIFKYINYSFYNFYYTLFWSLLIFNLIGIPPFVGFYIKILPLELALRANEIFLTILILISFLLISFIYLKILGQLIIVKKKIFIYNHKFNFSHLLSSLIILLSFPIFIIWLLY